MNKEKLTETTSVEEQNLLTEEQQTEIIVEKQSDIFNAQQDENKEVVSDITSQYQKIIEQALRIQFEIKLCLGFEPRPQDGRSRQIH